MWDNKSTNDPVIMFAKFLQWEYCLDWAEYDSLVGLVSFKYARFHKLQTPILYQVFLEYQIPETVGIISVLLSVDGGTPLSWEK